MTFKFFHIAAGEIAAARAVARAAGVIEHRFYDIPGMKEASDLRGRFRGLPSTYIPMRNSVFYGVAAGYAEEVGASLIVGGHNGDDAKVFRDVGGDFFKSLQRAFRAGSQTLDRNRLVISRPLSAGSKPEVVKLAVSLGVPLALTWSCHREGSTPCGVCQGCKSRRRAFKLAGVVDPQVRPLK